MNRSGFPPSDVQKFRKNLAGICLIVFVGAISTACKDNSEQARQQAEEEARLQKETDGARKAARNAAAGSRMDVLETLDGKSYMAVEIREVSAIGISIRHETGLARVPFENLPREMQDHFHFDPKEKERALHQEQRILQANAKRFDAAHKSMLDQNKQLQVTLDANRRKELQSALTIMSARVRQVESEIFSIQEELRSDPHTMRRTSFYYRTKGVSRAPIIRERLEAKQNQLSALRQKEAELKAALMR
jgi:hypothetical protein